MEWKQADVWHDLGGLRSIKVDVRLVEWNQAEISQSMGNIEKLVDDLYQKYMGKVPEGTLLGKWQALVVKLGNVCYIRDWDRDTAARMIEDVFKPSHGLDVGR